MTETRSAPADSELLRRAFAAWFRSEKAAGASSSTQPASGSYVTQHNAKSYVVLVNVNGVLAVYRVRTDGILKGLKRWPAEVEAEQAGAR